MDSTLKLQTSLAVDLDTTRFGHSIYYAERGKYRISVYMNGIFGSAGFRGDNGSAREALFSEIKPSAYIK